MLRHIAITGGILAAVSTAGAMAAGAFDWGSKAQPAIGSALLLGEVHLDPAPILVPVALEIPVTNVSRAPVSLRVETSCGCTSAEPPRLALAPGERREIAIRIAPSNRAVPDLVSLTLIGEHGARGELRTTLHVDRVQPFPDHATFQSSLTLPLNPAYAGHAIDAVSAYRGATDQEIQAALADDGAGVEIWPTPSTRSIEVVLHGPGFEGGKVVQRITLVHAEDDADHPNTPTTREENPS